jgi:glycosyltransferase involved in cell wall biosynthesis
LLPLVTYFVPFWDPHGDEQFVIPRFEKVIHTFFRNVDPSYQKEFFVICQGNAANSIEHVRALEKQYGFQTVILNQNRGLAGGMNLGFQLSRGKYMAVLSQDVLLTKGCDTTILNDMETNPNLYQVAPIADKSDYPHQRVLMSGEYTDTVNIDRIMAAKGGRAMGGTCIEVSLNYFPRTILKDVGYLDERWKGDYENADYGIRIAMAGKETIVHYGAFVWHMIHTTSDYIGRLTAYIGYIEGEKVSKGACEDLMWNKWSPTIRDESRWYQPGRMPDATRAVLRACYPQNIYLPYVQDRGY